jgi:uncharacterized damage-inducible protein DinB
MDVRDFAIHSLDEVQEVLTRSVEGLTQEELMSQPQPRANNIAFMLWHMARVEDWFFHYLFQRVPQLWESGRWHEKMDLPEDPKVTGFGYTAEQVAGFPSVQVSDLMAYSEAVRADTAEYLRNMDAARLDEKVTSRLLGEVSIGSLISHLVVELAQHVGQIAYVRGLVREPSSPS